MYRSISFHYCLPLLMYRSISFHYCLPPLMYRSISFHYCLLLLMYRSISFHYCLPPLMYRSISFHYCLPPLMYRSISFHYCLPRLMYRSISKAHSHTVTHCSHSDIPKQFHPPLTWYLRRIWAGVFWYFSAIAFTFGSSNSWGSSGFAHGRSGEPKGLYAVIVTPFDVQNCINFFWFKYGWHST
jgi:hypothetical protein